MCVSIFDARVIGPNLVQVYIGPHPAGGEVTENNNRSVVGGEGLSVYKNTQNNSSC
jgi:hypothetical protein